MNLYRNILKRSLLLTWKHKFLWFFGFFAAFLGSFGTYEILINRTNASVTSDFLFRFQDLQRTLASGKEFFPNLIRSFQDFPISITISILVILVLLALILFLVWLAVVSQVGLVSGAAQLVKAEKNSSELSIQKGIELGVQKFWPVLGVNVLFKILIYLIFFCFGLLFLFLVPQGSQILGNIIYILAFIIFIPIALIVAFILNYSICYIVIKDEPLTNSIKKSWRLFLDNWLVTLEMALILFSATFLATLIALMISFIIVIPFFLLINILIYLNFSGLSFWVVLFGTLLPAVLIAIIGAMLTVFQVTSWTNLFLQLTTSKSKKENLSKIVRWAEKLKN